MDLSPLSCGVRGNETVEWLASVASIVGNFQLNMATVEQGIRGKRD